MLNAGATAISLFAGCGGGDRGLADAGFRVVLANDAMRYARDVYRANLPATDFRLGDIRRLEKFPAADLLTGGYPCQGYSQAGARDPAREINALYLEFARALRSVRPKAFIVENVPGLAMSHNRRRLQDQLACFRAAGYAVTGPRILNAAHWGVPQDRKRVFIVGVRADLGVRYEFPAPTHDAGLPPPRENGRQRRQPELFAGGGGDAPLPPAVTQLERLGHTDGDWPDGEFYDRPFHEWYLSRNRRRSWDRPSWTIVANGRHMPLHPMSPPLKPITPRQWEFDGDPAQARRLSWREAAILQDLDGWEFPEGAGLMRKYEVIGNAVPPLLFRRIAEALPPLR